MDCLKAQQLAEDCAKGRLPERLCLDVQQHLSDCTDCRVAMQRAAKLQRLLALKRYEQPPQEYFDGFLAEFHRRQEDGTRVNVGWWEQFVYFTTAKPIDAWAFQFAGATAVAVAVAILWTGLRPADQSFDKQPQVTAFNPASPGIAPVGLPTVMKVASAGEGPDIVSPSDDADWPDDGNSINAAAARAARNPNYVLDRMEVTTVAYDPGIHF